MHFSLKFGKKGQGAEALTWVAATIVILVFVFIFLFAVNLLSPKALNIGFVSFEESGVETQQMLFTILETKVGGKEIYNLIREGDYSSINELKPEIEEILDKFAAKGIKCDFEAYLPGEIPIVVVR